MIDAVGDCKTLGTVTNAAGAQYSTHGGCGVSRAEMSASCDSVARSRGSSECSLFHMQPGPEHGTVELSASWLTDPPQILGTGQLTGDGRTSFEAQWAFRTTSSPHLYRYKLAQTNPLATATVHKGVDAPSALRDRHPLRPTCTAHGSRSRQNAALHQQPAARVHAE